MKNIFLISLCLAGALSINAQVTEETRVMSGGSQPALIILLPGADTKFADAEWKEYMKSYGKLARVKQAKECMVEGAQILDIGGVNRLNVYNLSEASSDGAKMIVWIDMGGGYVNSTTFPKEYAESVKFLQAFAHQVKVDQIALDLDNQQKLLTKSQNNLSKLQRENENLHRIIEEAEKRIAQAEVDITKNLQEQESAQKKLMLKNCSWSSAEKLELAKAEKAN